MGETHREPPKLRYGAAQWPNRGGEYGEGEEESEDAGNDRDDDDCWCLCLVDMDMAYGEERGIKKTSLKTCFLAGSPESAQKRAGE